jgi:hypothetical protein
VGAITALVLADHREGSTLRYSELARLAGAALSGLLPGAWIERMLADRDTSRAGRRAIRNLQTETCVVRLSGDPPRSVVVCDRDDEVVMSRAGRRVACRCRCPSWRRSSAQSTATPSPEG